MSLRQLGSVLFASIMWVNHVVAGTTQIDEFFKDRDESSVVNQYSENLSKGVLSKDGHYYQKGGTLATLQKTLNSYPINNITLLNIESDQAVSIEVPETLKQIFIRNSNFKKGLSIILNSLDRLVITGSEITGEFMTSDANNKTASDIYLSNNKFLAQSGEYKGLFWLSDLFGTNLTILDCSFDVEAQLMDVELKEIAWIQGNIFNDGFSIVGNDLTPAFHFLKNEVKGPAIFAVDRFKKETSFKNTEFYGDVTLSKITFDTKPVFARTRFYGLLDFSATDFSKGVDLRIAKFSKNKGIKLEAFEADLKNFNIDLAQLEKVKIIFTKPVEELTDGNERQQEEIARINKVYYQLKKSFINSGETREADKIGLMHSRVVNDIEHSTLSYMYDFFMAYGYEAWRYVAFVFIPSIFFFAIIYLRWFKEEINEVVRRKDQHPIEEALPSHSLATMARMIVMSGSILFAIRYKTVWISDNIGFNQIVMANYFFGIGLYILFALGTRTSSFDIVKSLIGI